MLNFFIQISVYISETYLFRISGGFRGRGGSRGDFRGGNRGGRDGGAGFKRPAGGSFGGSGGAQNKKIKFD